MPEGMRETLMRPGLLHTLPRPLQALLLPPNQSAEATLLAISSSSPGVGQGGDRRRRRRRARVEDLEGVGDTGERGRGRGSGGSPRTALGVAGAYWGRRLVVRQQQFLGGSGSSETYFPGKFSLASLPGALPRYFLFAC